MTPEPVIKRGGSLRLSTSGQEKIAIGKIRRDGGTQPRAETSEEHIKRMVEALDDGEELPPVVVYYDGSDYWLADGFHRFAAHQKKLIPEISAEIRQGDRREAVLYSVGANKSHGLPRSRDDQRRAIETLLRDAEWGTWSDREIARQVGCSHVTVGTARERLSSGGQIDHMTERKAPDGKIYSVAPKAQPAPPQASEQAETAVRCKVCREYVTGSNWSWAVVDLGPAVRVHRKCVVEAARMERAAFESAYARPAAPEQPQPAPPDPPEPTFSDYQQAIRAADGATTLSRLRREIGSDRRLSEDNRGILLALADERIAEIVRRHDDPAPPARTAYALPEAKEPPRPDPPFGWAWVDGLEWGYQLQHEATGRSTRNWASPDRCISDAMHMLGSHQVDTDLRSAERSRQQELIQRAAACGLDMSVGPSGKVTFRLDGAPYGGAKSLEDAEGRIKIREGSLASRQQAQQSQHDPLDLPALPEGWHWSTFIANDTTTYQASNMVKNGRTPIRSDPADVIADVSKWESFYATPQAQPVPPVQPGEPCRDCGQETGVSYSGRCQGCYHIQQAEARDDDKGMTLWHLDQARKEHANNPEQFARIEEIARRAEAIRAEQVAVSRISVQQARSHVESSIAGLLERCTEPELRALHTILVADEIPVGADKEDLNESIWQQSKTLIELTSAETLIWAAEDQHAAVTI